MNVGQDCMDCEIKKQLEDCGLAGTCNVNRISQILEDGLSV